MAFEWTDKVDGVDDVLAEDINGVANEVVRIGNKIESDEFVSEIAEKVMGTLPIAEEATF